jgi:hypothetical protein
VQELARFFRKGEEYERLYTVAQSQLQLEKDRFLELQRRYFAVCREMAIQAGLPANMTDADIKSRTDELVDGADAQTRERAARLQQGARPQGNPNDNGGGGGALAVAAGPGGEERKKRRRRRKRRVAGEPTHEDVPEGEAHDDGDDGDDGEPEVSGGEQGAPA